MLYNEWQGNLSLFLFLGWPYTTDAKIRRRLIHLSYLHKIVNRRTPVFKQLLCYGRARVRIMILNNLFNQEKIFLLGMIQVNFLGIAKTGKLPRSETNRKNNAWNEITMENSLYHLKESLVFTNSNIFAPCKLSKSCVGLFWTHLQIH